MVRRVISHLVKPSSAAIEQHKLGCVAIGVARRFTHFGLTQHSCIIAKVGVVVGRTCCIQPDDRVALPKIKIAAGARLVMDLMGTKVGSWGGVGHRKHLSGTVAMAGRNPYDQEARQPKP